MGENHFAQRPTFLYAVVAFMSGVAYDLLVRAIRKANHEDYLLGNTKKNHKGNLSLVLYAVAIAMSFINPAISFALFVAVAVMWFIPDKRVEEVLSQSSSTH
jgi:uncharacterized membrane protein